VLAYRSRLELTNDAGLQVDVAEAADEDPLMANILLADTGVACVSAECQNHAPASQQLTPQHRPTKHLLSSCVVGLLQHCRLFNP
jgi:hypothetical protein